MHTTYIVFAIGEAPVTHACSLSDPPTFEELKAIVEPILGAPLEHVSCLQDGRRADLFVDELSANKGLPRNDEATRIYRTNMLTTNPDLDPETLPVVFGPAVMFSRQVWF